MNIKPSFTAVSKNRAAMTAERGGSCDMTKPDETVVVQGVSIIGAINPAGKFGVKPG
jgi:NAD/NADP transhydrogenase alpha subunit